MNKNMYLCHSPVTYRGVNKDMRPFLVQTGNLDSMSLYLQCFATREYYTLAKYRYENKSFVNYGFSEVPRYVIQHTTQVTQVILFVYDLATSKDASMNRYCAKSKEMEIAVGVVFTSDISVQHHFVPRSPAMPSS